MNNEKRQNVFEFYFENVEGLKEKERQGWIDCKVKGRRESISEHCWSTQNLAFAIWSEFDLDLDINKTMQMLQFHETEEIKIGDNTPYGKMSPEEKLKRGHKAVKDICSGLKKGQIIIDLINEFDAKETAEAQFANYCDKMDCDSMAVIYSDSGRLSLEDMLENEARREVVQQIMNKGAKTAADVWLEMDRKRYQDSALFTEFLDFLMEHQIKR